MSNTPNLQNMRILIIDDNPVLVNVFARLLRIKGFFVAVNTTFNAGLQNLQNELYHVVFVDAPLDGYDNKQILTMLQKNQIFQKTFVFLFSSVDFDKIELDKWKNQGLYSYLKKPVKRSVMIQALDDVYKQINFTTPQISSESVEEDEESTPQQLIRLEQLKKQIQEFKNIPQQLTSNQKGSQEKNLKSVTSKPIVDVSSFTNIINDLRTFQSKFEHAEQHMKKSNIETDAIQKEIITKDIEKTLLEISELKNEIQLLDKISKQELKQNQVPSIYKKKRKIKKRHVARTRTKKLSKNKNKK